MPTLTNAINANLTTPLTSIQGGSGVSAPTANGILVANGDSPFSSTVLSNGQLLIGDTSSAPVAATITAGAGISVTNGAGSITIANTEPAGTTWIVETSGPVTMAPGNGYISNSASSITYVLPTVAAVGDTYQVNSMNTGGFDITQNALQSIIVGNETTTVGVTGSVDSHSTTGDWLTIVCAVANTTFIAFVNQGEVIVS